MWDMQRPPLHVYLERLTSWKNDLFSWHVVTPQDGLVLRACSLFSRSIFGDYSSKL